MKDKTIEKPLNIAMLSGAVIIGTKNILLFYTVLFCFIVPVDHMT